MPNDKFVFHDQQFDTKEEAETAVEEALANFLSCADECGVSQGEKRYGLEIKVTLVESD